MAKANIELGAKWTGGGSFVEANDSIKKLAKSTKDVSDIGVKAFGAISSHLDGPFASSLGLAKSALTGLVSGGVFGVVAAAGEAAFGAIAEYISECEKKAQQLAVAVAENAGTVFEGIKVQAETLRQEMAESSKATDEMIRAVQGKLNGDLKFELANLNLQTLQQITDGMTDAEKNLVRAHGAYMAELQKGRSAIAIHANVQSIITRRLDELATQRAEAEQLVIRSENEKAFLHKQYSGTISAYIEAEKEASQSLADMIAWGLSETEAKKRMAAAQARLAKLTEEHGKEIEAWKAATSGLANAERMITGFTAEEAKLRQKLAESQSAERVAREEFAAAKLQASMAERDATAAMERDRMATAEKEAKARAAAEARAEADGIAAELASERAEWDRRIFDEVKATTEEHERLMRLVNQGLEDGLEDAEIEEGLRREWQDILAKRNEAERKEAERIEKERSAEDREKDRPSAIASVSASITNGAALANENEKVIGFRNAMAEQRQGDGKTRAALHSVRQDQASAIKYLRGEMPPKVAKQFKEYIAEYYDENKWKKLMATVEDGLITSPRSKEYQKMDRRADELHDMLFGRKGDKDSVAGKVDETNDQLREIKKQLEKANTIQ